MKAKKIRLALVIYDLIVMIVTAYFVLVLASGGKEIGKDTIFVNAAVFALVSFTCRFAFGIYNLVWRYGGIQSYVKLMMVDLFSFAVYFVIVRIARVSQMLQVRMLAFVLADLLCSLGIRMIYRYAYKYCNDESILGKFLSLILKVFGNIDVDTVRNNKKIKVAILGAGNTGVSLVNDMRSSKESIYEPMCFVDISKTKTGRSILGLKVYQEDSNLRSRLSDLGVQQVIITVSNLDHDKRKELFEYYKSMGFQVMMYETPQLESAGEKPKLREVEVEELLFRQQQIVVDDRTKEYYKGRVILITGGGGSIGSELCRQLANMEPKMLIVLDVYENGAYDIQQELRLKYRDKLNLSVEICSIVEKKALERVFSKYRPQIVINAAAHKHVPLMEHNCIEAIENNVFGCRNVIDCCEQFGTERFMMVSTDKAVNPTNVMGATKRMCEMIAQSASLTGHVVYSATRFGNVLGSAGSVIPLFKKQIAAGGPVTITDKRIIRYFMTIPEASQLVLASGAMAKNGELFVLDMGQPVKILDLAESMIRLTGAHDIEIIETGLRPGEKLYEELLVKTEELDKTDNSLIFIERDTPLPRKVIAEKLETLEKACKSGDDDKAREALRSVVPTFKKPEEVNGTINKMNSKGEIA